MISNEEMSKEEHVADLWTNGEGWKWEKIYNKIPAETK